MTARWWCARWRGVVGASCLISAIYNIPTTDGWSRVGWSILMLMGLDLYIRQTLKDVKDT
jgi:hypothetical protein